MNKDAEDRVQKKFAGVEDSLSRTDPEFVEIIANFSQDETVKASQLTEKEQMYCGRNLHQRRIVYYIQNVGAGYAEL